MKTERTEIKIPEGQLTVEYFIDKLAPISAVPRNFSAVLRKELLKLLDRRQFDHSTDDVITKFARERFRSDLSDLAALRVILYSKAVAWARVYNDWQNADPNETRDRLCSLNLNIIRQNLDREFASFIQKVGDEEMAEQVIQLVEDRFHNPKTLSTFGYGPNSFNDFTPDGEALWKIIVVENGDWEYLQYFATEDKFDLEAGIQNLRNLDLLDETDPTRLRWIGNFPI